MLNIQATSKQLNLTVQEYDNLKNAIKTVPEEDLNWIESMIAELYAIPDPQEREEWCRNIASFAEDLTK